MRRRDFLRSGVAGTGALLASAAGLGASEHAGEAGRQRPFRLDYAPHFGMFEHHAGKDLMAQLRFMAEQGFRSLEDNGMRGRPREVQEQIGRELERLGMRMGVFVAHTLDWNKPTLASGDPAIRERFLNDVRQSVEVAKRVNAKWMTTVPGVVDPRLDMEYQTAHVIETLKRAAEIFEPHGLVMTVETLNTRRDHPGQFLTRIAQAYALCKAVDSPAVKMIFDCYHAQIEEGNLIPNIDLAWDEIAYVQTGDNPGRKEPTTGEINYLNVFAHLHRKGFRGIVGMEHGNSRPGKEGERAVIDAYRHVDSF
jgi:hydroxypyruvate isomerase